VAARPSTALQSNIEPIARPAPRPIVTVVCGGQSSVIDLRRMRATRFRHLIVVRLDELWFASRLGADMTGLGFDFIGEDGFRPSVAGGCAPLPGDLLKSGYLNTRSRDLVWDHPSIDAAFSVRGVATIVAHER
jgi:hypothetical protein